MLMLRRGHLGTLRVRIEAFDGRKQQIAHRMNDPGLLKQDK